VEQPPKTLIVDDAGDLGLDRVGPLYPSRQVGFFARSRRGAADEIRPGVGLIQKDMNRQLRARQREVRVDFLFEQILTFDGVEWRPFIGRRRLDQDEALRLRERQHGSDDPFAAVEVDVGRVCAVQQHDDGIVDDAGIVAQVSVNASSLGEWFGKVGLEELLDVGTDQTDDGDRPWSGRGQQVDAVGGLHWVSVDELDAARKRAG
jgi:hypothetical protein